IFKTIVTCEDIREQKPSPAIYKLVLDNIGIEPGHCVAIEDTYNGNKSATDAGITSVITTHMFTLDDQFEGAAMVVNKLGEPDSPMKVISGNAHGSNYVTLELLDELITDKKD
ncbi:MAG: HAD-IA family hydrolase, partial [Gammaproteobacteria bacterium]|nr:HAD-IA family hydrolase [Gammaproteobacteria bacterium]